MVSVRFENKGPTTARKCAQVNETRVVPIQGLQQERFDIKPPDGVTRVAIGPSGIISTVSKIINGEEIGRVCEGISAALLYAKCVYVDVCGEPHVSEICSYTVPLRHPREITRENVNACLEWQMHSYNNESD
jgi:hypothetical protein